MAALDLLAAPGHHLTGRGWLVLIAAGLGSALWYLIVCAIYPFANCWWCKGEPRRYQNERRRAWRLCRVCKGTGGRLRIGRRAWDYFRRPR